MIKGYTSKIAIENYLLIDIDPSFDSQIDKWIGAVEKYIDNQTDRDFAIAEDESGSEEERVYDGDGSNTLRIDPAVEVTSVKLSPTDNALDAEKYVLYPANKTVKDKIVLRNLRFPRGLQNIVVGGRFGLDAVPADIEFAATVLVAGIINFAWQSEGEVQSITIGRYSVTYKNQKEISDFEKVQEILKNNKRYTV
jgi:hypothetical protein